MVRDLEPNYVTLLCHNEHSLRALSFVMSRLTNVQHSLYKGYSQGVIMICYHAFMQRFPAFQTVFFNECIERVIITLQ